MLSAIATFVPHPQHLFFSLLLTCFVFAGVPPTSNATPSSDFSRLLDDISSRTQTVTTDREAIKVISPYVLKETARTPVTRRKPSKTSPNALLPDEIVPLGIQLIREIGIFYWAAQFPPLLEPESISQARTSFEEKKAFFRWVKGNTPQPELNRVLSLTGTLLELTVQAQTPSGSRNGYWKFAQHTFDTYPDWTGSDSGWLSVAEHNGTRGILERLESYWEMESDENSPPGAESVAMREAYTGRFVQQQIIPILTTYLKALMLELQAQYKWHARNTWDKLQAWETRQHEVQDLVRLCGTWQWLIHNHQNHGDHKTVMVYPHPSQYNRMVPRPATIQVQGDTVYIRWEFPNGIIQEESLLFSEKDRMLSGTFVNNMGPNGNISAKRVAPCQD